MENITKSVIGQRINSALNISGKKQKELAAVLGVPDNTISYFVSGKRTPNTEQIIKIAQYLKVSADFLLGLTNASAIVSEDNKTIRDVCDYTGLTENAVYYLLERNVFYFMKEQVASQVLREFGHEWDNISDFFDRLIVYSEPLRDAVANYCNYFIREAEKLTPIYKNAFNIFESFKNGSSSIEELEEQEELLSDRIRKIDEVKKYRFFCICEESKDLFDDYLRFKLPKQDNAITELKKLQDDIFRTVLTYYHDKKEQSEV